jgi:hypothetical protein
MSAEYLTAIASIVTAAIIAATAIAALVQLRHMRSANTINAMLALRNLFDDERHSEARNSVRTGAVERAMRDPAFRAYLTAFSVGGGEAPPSAAFAKLNDHFVRVANTFETIGNMVKKDILSKDDVLDEFSFVIEASWRRLEPFIAYARACPGSTDRLFENFEYMTVLARTWIAKNPSQYPAGMPRIPLTNSYPIETLPAKDPAPRRL